MSGSLTRRAGQPVWWLAGLALIGIVAPWFGWPVAVAVVACALPWVVILARRGSAAFAVAAVASFALLALFASLIATQLVPGIPALAGLTAAQVLIATGGIAQVFRSPSAARPDDLMPTVAAMTGAVVWCVVLVVARLLPGASAHSWVMAGDGATNILFARELIEANGVSLEPSANPVPFTTAVIAASMMTSRAAGGQSAAADISGLTEAWAAIIAGCCVAAGILAARLMRAHRPLQCVGAGLVSLTPLTWVALVPAVEGGFVNASLSILVVLLATALSLPHDRPVVAVAAILALLILVLATWSPLVLIPGLMLVVVVVRERRALRASSLRSKLVLGGLTLLLAIYFVLLPLRSLIALGEVFRDSTGGAYQLRNWFLLLAIIAWVCAALLFGVTRGWDAVLPLAAIPIGGGIALAALLWPRRGEDEIWSYYTIKLAWLLMVLLLIAAAALALAAVRRAWTFVVVVAAMVVVFSIGKFAMTNAPEDYPELLDTPLQRILAGTYSRSGGDNVFHESARRLDGTPVSIPWRVADPDAPRVLSWVIQLSADGPGDIELRTFAYVRDMTSTADVCRVRELIGPPVTVDTADAEFAREIIAACPDAGDVELAR